LGLLELVLVILLASIALHIVFTLYLSKAVQRGYAVYNGQEPIEDAFWEQLYRYFLRDRRSVFFWAALPFPAGLSLVAVLLLLVSISQSSINVIYTVPFFFVVLGVFVLFRNRAWWDSEVLYSRMMNRHVKERPARPPVVFRKRAFMIIAGASGYILMIMILYALNPIPFTPMGAGLIFAGFVVLACVLWLAISRSGGTSSQ
jgi:hypothetical protein